MEDVDKYFDSEDGSVSTSLRFYVGTKHPFVVSAHKLKKKNTISIKDLLKSLHSMDVDPLTLLSQGFK